MQFSHCKVTTVSSVPSFTFTTPAVLIHIISRRTDAGERAGGVHTSVLTQKLREAALIQVYRELKKRINTHQTKIVRAAQCLGGQHYCLTATRSFVWIWPGRVSLLCGFPPTVCRHAGLKRLQVWLCLSVYSIYVSWTPKKIDEWIHSVNIKMYYIIREKTDHLNLKCIQFINVQLCSFRV